MVLSDYVDFFLTRLEKEIRDTEGALNKLRKLIRIHITMYAHNRVFSRILILEVRNHPDYFQSDAYNTVKRYTSLLMRIIEEGRAEGSIRRDIPLRLSGSSFWEELNTPASPASFSNGH